MPSVVTKSRSAPHHDSHLHHQQPPHLQQQQYLQQHAQAQQYPLPGSPQRPMTGQALDSEEYQAAFSELDELRVLAANYEASAPQAGGGGDSRTNALLEQLLTRLDKLEAQVSATAQQQQQLGKQQARLETVAVESIRVANGGR